MKVEKNLEKVKKQNNILTKDKIVNFLKQPIIYVLIFCIFVQLQIYKTVPDYVLTNDSTTYMQEFEGSIRNLQVDATRTPVYPYIIKVIEKIGGSENLYNNIVIFQKILFIFTIILFYYSIQKITKNKIISSVLSIIFGICPFLVLWNVTILTEAIALFEITLLSFITIKYLKSPNNYLAGSMRNTYISDDYD